MGVFCRIDFDMVFGVLENCMGDHIYDEPDPRKLRLNGWKKTQNGNYTKVLPDKSRVTVFYNRNGHWSNEWDPYWSWVHDGEYGDKRDDPQMVMDDFAQYCAECDLKFNSEGETMSDMNTWQRDCDFLKIDKPSFYLRELIPDLTKSEIVWLNKGLDACHLALGLPEPQKIFIAGDIYPTKHFDSNLQQYAWAYILSYRAEKAMVLKKGWGTEPDRDDLIECNMTGPMEKWGTVNWNGDVDEYSFIGWIGRDGNLITAETLERSRLPS